MSAFIVNDIHLKALIGYGYQNQITVVIDRNNILHLQTEEDAEKALNILHKENVRSVNARYSTKDKAEHKKFTLDLTTLSTYTPVEILKMCDCFDYQACESKNYYITKAAEIVQKLRKHAIGKLAGYVSAPWELKEVKGTITRIL